MLTHAEKLSVVTTAGVVGFCFGFSEKEKNRSCKLVCKKKKKIDKGSACKAPFENVVPNLKLYVK